MNNDASAGLVNQCPATNECRIEFRRILMKQAGRRLSETVHINRYGARSLKPIGSTGRPAFLAIVPLGRSTVNPDGGSVPSVFVPPNLT